MIVAWILLLIFCVYLSMEILYKYTSTCTQMCSISYPPGYMLQNKAYLMHLSFIGQSTQKMPLAMPVPHHPHSQELPIPGGSLI